MFDDRLFNDVPVSPQILLTPFADHPELQLWRVGLVYSVNTTTNSVWNLV